MSPSARICRIAAPNQLTLEALADVDANRTTDHAEIEAWAAGLSKPKSRKR